MKTSTSIDAADNKKTRHKLKKFLTRRPTLQAVRDKGYIKGTERPLHPVDSHCYNCVITVRNGTRNTCLRTFEESVWEQLIDRFT